MSDNFGNNNNWIWYDTEGIKRELKKQTEIEEERLMLEKAKALNDMSIYENYLAEREIRRETERKEEAEKWRTITILSTVFVDAGGACLVYTLLKAGTTRGILWIVFTAAAFTVYAIYIIHKKYM